MSAGTKRWRSAVAGALLVGVIGGGLLATQGSAAPPKYYTVAGTPGAVGATPTAASITINNTTNNPISFSAANLDFPAGLTVSGTGLGITQGTVTLTNGGTRLELREMNVGRRQSVTVSFLVSAQPSLDCTAYVVTSDVRQSNNFQGADNKFALTGSEVSFNGPCGAVVECLAGDTEICTTGTVTSPNGNTAVVTLNDDDGLTGTLRAILLDGGLSCPEYTATSDQLFFDFTIANDFEVGDATKTVEFNQAAGPNPRPLHEYQACFKAPYDFPALLPSQLLQDLNVDGWWGNTTPEDGEYKGLLLPCDLTAGLGLTVDIGLEDEVAAPCVSGRSLEGGIVSIEITTPAADPLVRF